MRREGERERERERAVGNKVDRHIRDSLSVRLAVFALIKKCLVYLISYLAHESQ